VKYIDSLAPNAIPCGLQIDTISSGGSIRKDERGRGGKNTSMYIVLYCTLYDTISSGGRIRKDERGRGGKTQACILYCIVHCMIQ
jgi:hypothetical protein